MSDRSSMVELVKWGMVSLAIPAAAAIHGDFERRDVQQHSDIVRTAEDEAVAFKRDGDYLLLLIPRLSSKDVAEAEVARVVLFSLADQRQSTLALKNAAKALRDAAAVLREKGDPDGKVQSVQISTADATAQNATPSAPPPETVTGVSVQSLAPAAPLPVLPARAYIQFYASSQRAKAETLQAELIRRGVAVPGLENVVATHPGQPRVITYAQRGAIGVRYFHASDQSAAVALALVVREVLGTGTTVQLQDQSRAGTDVKQGQVELWLPCQPTPEGDTGCA